MSLSDYIPEKFIGLFSDPDFSKAIKGYNMYLIKEDEEYRTEVQTYFNECILTSELIPIPRIAKLEAVTGICDYSDFDEEEHDPTIPEQISILSEKIETISEPIRASIKEPVNVPTSKTEIRASALVEHLKDTGKDHLTSHEIVNFLKSKLPESCKIDKNIQNIRKVKQDVLNKAADMYPNVFLNKKPTGHKEVRLILSL